MENDIKALSSEKQSIKNEMDSLRTSGANMENKNEDCSNKLKDTVDQSAILSLELEKATLVENKVQTLLAENLKLKNDNLMLLVEHENLKESLEKLDMECFKLRKIISDTKAENEYMSQEKYTVERTVDQLAMDIKCLNMEKEELESRLEQELEKISHMQKTNEALELANSNARDEIIKIQGEKNEALASITDLNSELKQQANHISNLQETIKDLEAAKYDLYNESMVYQEEKIEALAQLQKVEGYVKNLESQLAQQLEKISHVEKTHKACIIEHESKLAQQGTHISNVQYTNRDLEAAKTNLYNKVLEHQEERTTTLAHLHRAEASMKKLESQLKIQLEKISLMERTHEALIADLGSKMEQQSTQISNLQKINRDLEQEKTELYNKFKVHQEEKTTTIAQLEQIEASMRNLENKSEQQAKHISNVQQTNRNLEATKIDLNNKVMVQQEEKHAALAQLKQVEASMKNLEGQFEQQLKKTTHMEQTYGAFISDLESKLEQQAKHISNLEEINKNLVATKSDLNNRVMVQQEEKSAAIFQLQQVEASIKNLEGQLEQQLKKTSHMEQTYGAFISDLESKLEQQVKHISNLQETNKELEDTKNCLYNKLTVQQEEKTALLAKLQQVEASVKNLEGQLDQQLKKKSQMEKTYGAFISDLESKLEQQAKHISNHQETNRNLEASKSDLNNRVIIQQEEKSAALAKLQQVEASMKNLEGQLQQQLKKTSQIEQTYGAFISDLEGKLEQKGKYLSNLQETNRELEATKIDLNNHIKVQQEEKIAALAKLEQVEASLRDLEGQLEQQLKKTSHMEQTYGAFISDLESKLEQQARQISNLQETNKELEDTKACLHNKVTVQHEEKIALLAKLQQVEASVKNLEGQLDQQLEKTSQIEKTYGAFISDLEGKLEQKGKYISSLQETNRELEATKIDLNNHIKVQQEEKIVKLAKLKQIEASLRDLEDQFEQQLKKTSHMEQTYGAFISDLESKLEQQAKHISNLQETNKELEDTKACLHNEVTIQHEEKTALLAKLQQVEASVKNLEGQLDQQLKKTSQMEQTYGAFISDLERKLEQQAKHISNHQESNRNLEATKSDLNNRVIIQQEEKSAALAKLQQVEASMKNLEGQLQQQLKKTLQIEHTYGAFISDLEGNLEQKGKYISSLQDTNRELEAMKIDLNNHIKVEQEEKISILAKLQQVEASQRDLDGQLEQQLKKTSHMEQTYGAFISDLESKLEQQAKHISKLQETNKELEDTKACLHNEVTIQHEEKTALLAKLQQVEASVKNLEGQLDQQLKKTSQMEQTYGAFISDLELKLEQQAKHISNHQESNRNLEATKSDLNNRVIIQQEEKSAALAKLQQVEASMKNLEGQLQQQLKKTLQIEQTYGAFISDLERNLEQKGKYISSLQETNRELEATKFDLNNHIKVQQQEKIAELAKLHQVEASLRDLEGQLEQQLKKMLHMEQTYGAFISDLESKLEQQAKHISNLQETNKELEDTKACLHNKVTVQHEEKTALLAKLQQVEASVQNLEGQLDQQLKKTSQMEQTYGAFISDLESKLKLQAQHISNHQETNRNLEATKSDLNNRVIIQQEEKSAALAKLQQVEASMKNIEGQLQQQLKKTSQIEQTYGAFISDLEGKLEQKGKYISSHQDTNRELEAMKINLNNHIKVEQEEKIAILTKLQQVEASQRDLDGQLEQQLKKTSHMEQTYGAFISDLESKLEQQAKHISNLQETNTELEDTKACLHNEVTIQHEEKTALLAKLQQVEASVKNLEGQLDQQLKKTSQMEQTYGAFISDLELKLEQQAKHISNHQETNRNLEATKSDLNNRVIIQQEEKSAALAKLQQVEASMKNLEGQLQQQLKKTLQIEQTYVAFISDLERNLEQKGKYISSLQETNRELEATKIDLNNHIKVQQQEKIAELAKLHQVEASLRDLEGQLEQQVKKTSHMEQSYGVVISDLESKLEQQANHISNLQEINKELEHTKACLHNKVTVQHEEKTALLAKLQQVEASVKNLEGQLDQQLKKTSQMEQTYGAFISDLESKLELQAKHISNHQETNRNLEASKSDLNNMVIILQEEKSAALAKLQQVEASMKNLEGQLQQQLKKTSQIEQTYGAFISDLEGKLEQKGKYISSLQDTNRELEATKIDLNNHIKVEQVDKIAVLAKLQKVEVSQRDLEGQLEQQLKKTSHIEQTYGAFISDLESKLEQQAKHISNLQETNKELEDTKACLHNKVTVQHEEKTALLSKLQQVEASVKNLEGLLDQQLKKTSQMEQTYGAFISDLESKLEQQAKQISNHQETNRDLEASKSDLNNMVIVLQEEKSAALAKLQQVEASMKNLEGQLQQQLKKTSQIEQTYGACISDLEGKLEQKGKYISSLQDTNRELEAMKIDLNNHIKVEQEEKIAVLAKLQQVEASQRDLDGQLEQQLKKTSHMEQTYGAFISDLEGKLEQQAKHISNLQETSKELEDTKACLDNEVTIQHEEKTALLAKLQQVEASVKNLEGQLDQQLKKTSQMEQTYGAFISDLESMLERQDKHISNHQETNRNLEATKSDLNNRVIVQQEEKSAALAKLQQVEASMKNLESHLQQQLQKTSQIEQIYGAFISDLEGKLEQKGIYISSLQETNRELEATKIDLNNHIKLQQEEKITALAKLQQVEASLRDLEGQLEQQIKKTSHMEQSYGVVISDLESKLEQQANHISNLQETNKKLEDTKGCLHNEVTVQHEEITALLAKLQQVEASVKNLEGQLDQQLNKTSQVEQTYGAFFSDFEGKLEQKGKYISSLQETNRELEEMKIDLNNHINVQQEEKIAELAKLQQVEASLRDLEGHLEQQLKKTSHMEQTYGAFISDLESKLEQQAKHISNLQVANKVLEDTKASLHNEVTVQHEEKSALLAKLQQVEASVKNLEGQLDQQLKKTSQMEQTYGAFISDLESKLAQQAKHISNHQETNRNLEATKSDLNNRAIIQQEEKSAALAKLQQVEASMKNVECQLLQQLKKTSQIEQTYGAFISDLEGKLEQKGKYISILQETNRELEATKIDLNNHIKLQQEEKIAALAKLQQVEASLRDLEGQLEQQVKKTSHMKQTYCVVVSDLASKLEKQANHISNLQETNKELEDTKGCLHNEVTVQHEEKTALLAKLQQVEASVENLEGQLDQQLKKTSQIEQTYGAFISDLESKLEQQAKHISNHQETNRNLEVTKSDLYNRVIIQEEEKSAELAKLQQVEASMKNLEGLLQQQLKKTSQVEHTYGAFISDLEGKMEQKGKYISSLQETNRELETTKIDLNNHIKVQQEEKIAALAKLQQVEASQKDLEGQLEQQLKKMSHMEQTYGAFISDLESKLEQQAKHISNLQETNKELEDIKACLHNEVTVQHEEKTALLAMLQQVEASVKNLEDQLDQQLKNTSQMEQTYGAFISDLESKLEQQAKHISNHQETNRNLEATKSDLNNRVIVQQEEKSETLAKLQQVEASMKNLEGQLQHQLMKTSQIEQTYGAFISDLEGKLEEKGKYISSLQETNRELEATKIDLNNHIKVQHEEKIAALAKLQQVEASLKDFEGQLEQQLKKTSHMEQTYGAFIIDLESKLEQEAKLISNLQETNKELEDTKGSLHNKVTVQHEEKTTLLSKLQQVEDSVKNLEGQLDQKLKKTSQMEQTYGAFISDLECKLEQQAKLISNHQETNRNLEATKIDLNNRVIIQQEEKGAALAKLQQVEASMKNLEGQLQHQLKKTSQIEQTYGAFISDLERKLEQQANHISNLQETNQELEAQYIPYEEKISCMRKKNEDLNLAYSNLQNKIMEMQGEKSEALASIANLKSKLEEQALRISYVQDTNKDLEATKYNLYNESMVHQEEKSAALAQLEQVKGAMKNLENQFEEQLEKFSHMEKTHKCFIVDLNSKLQQQATHMTNLQETNRDLEVSKIGLYNKVMVYQEEKITALAKLQQVEASVKNLEGQLQQKLETILHMQKINKALELANSNLQNEITEMQGENNAALLSIVDLKIKFQEQARHISNLQETNKDLEAKVTDMFQENVKLHANVKDLEVQLQLMKEKLKVAEVENKWKEDRYATTVETLQAEIQNLEQLVSVLEETLDDVKGHAETGIFSLAEKLDELESSLSQGLTRFVYRSSTSSEELKVLRKKLHDHFDEQKELLKKNDKLAKRFRDNEKVLLEMVKNDAKAGIIEKKVEDKESRAERTNYMTIFSRRWPILRRKWRRNSYSVG